jgi:hypothetical protein
MRGCINGALLSTMLCLTGWAYWEAHFVWQGIVTFFAWIFVMIMFRIDQTRTKTLVDELRKLQKDTAANLAEGDQVAATIRDMTCPKCGEKKCEL